MRARLPLVLGALAALLLGVAFYFLLWQPRAEEQAELEDEIANLIARQAQLSNEINQLEEIQANELQIRAALARLEEYIPTGPAQPTAIRQLQLSADAAGVRIASVNFGSPVLVGDAPETGDPATSLASLGVTVVAEGGYFQMVDFFRRLEVDVPRAVLIQTITMGAGTPGYPTLSSTWSGQLFATVPTVSAAPSDDEDEDGEEDPDDVVDVEEGE